MMKNIGIVGSGFWVDAMYLPSLLQNRVCNVPALAGHSLTSTIKLQERFGIPVAYHGVDSYKHLLNEKLDGIIVASPTHTHYEITKFFLTNKIPVLCEKPLANSVKECQELVDLAKKYNLVNSVGFTYSYLPEYRYLIKYARSNINSIKSFMMIWNAGFMADVTESNDKYNALLGNRLISDVLSHFIYIALKMFGPIKCVNSKTLYYSSILKETVDFVPSELGGNFEIEFKNGIKGTFQLTSDSLIDSLFKMNHLVHIKFKDGSSLQLFNNWKDMRTVTLNGRNVLDEVQKMSEIPLTSDVIGDYKKIFRTTNVMARKFVQDLEQEIYESPNFQDGLEVQKVVEQILDLDNFC